jgi:hypothetical protein
MERFLILKMRFHRNMNRAEKSDGVFLSDRMEAQIVQSHVIRARIVEEKAGGSLLPSRVT